MPHQLETEPQPGIAELVGGIVQDARDLLAQQLKLFQVEVKSDLRQTKEASIPLAIGAMIALLGVGILALGAGYLLCWTWPELPLWAGLAIVGGGLLLIGGALALWGKCKFDAFNPLPDETLEGMKENIQWKTRN